MIDQFIIGFLAWSLVEYFVHRFEHRFRPEQHNVHHMRPWDYGVGPSWSAVFMLAGTTSGLAFATSTMTLYAGFVAGYLFYAWVHYSCHHRRPAWEWLTRLHRRHALHHRQPDKNYGVSTALWDIIFRTEARTP